MCRVKLRLLIRPAIDRACQTPTKLEEGADISNGGIDLVGSRGFNSLPSAVKIAKPPRTSKLLLVDETRLIISKPPLASGMLTQDFCWGGGHKLAKGGRPSQFLELRKTLVRFQLTHSQLLLPLSWDIRA